MEAIGLALIGAVTEAVFGHLLLKSEPKLREWLGRDPAKLAFQTAFARSYTQFDRKHHEWTEALFDQAFLCRADVSWELSRLLVEGDSPDVEVVAGAWSEYFADHRRMRRKEEITPVVQDFLAGLERELRQQEAMRPAYDSRALDSIAASTTAMAADTAELRRLLEQALAVAHLSHTHATLVRVYPALQDYSYDFGDVIARVTHWFVGREPLFAALDGFMQQHPCGYFRIVADAGLGKTAIAAALAQRYDGPVHFFSASDGITSPERCLNHLCAQLIARFDLPHTHLPERAGADAAFLKSLLAEAAARQEGSPLLLVVDALDEAEPVPLGHNVAHFPGSLPRGVYIILTHRPGDYPVETEAATRVQLYAITWDDPNQQDDIESHLRRQAERPEIRRALDEATPPVTPDRFVRELKQRSEGNFKYLDYVLADIEARTTGFDPLRLKGLPRGLDGYYEHFWKRMEAMGKADGWHDWRDLYKPVLAFLAAAVEPVTPLWLALQSRRPVDEVEERVLVPWQRFLRRQRQDGRDTWAIVHNSFADFLATKVDLTAAHKAIAGYYLNVPALWPDDIGYAFRHLSAHLAQAGMLSELGDLVENRTWYEAQRDYDLSLAAYAEDVNRALVLAEARGLDGLAQVVAWSLLYATVRTRATQVPIEALEAMVLLGQGGRAMRYAALITDPKKQSEGYLRLGRDFVARGQVTMAQSAVCSGLGVAQSIGDEWSCTEVLRGATQAMAQIGDRLGLRRVLMAVENIADEESRARALSGMVQALAQVGDLKGLHRVLMAVEDIRDEESRAAGLNIVAQALAQLNDLEGLQRVLTATGAIAYGAWRSVALSGVAQALAQIGDRESFWRALAMAERTLMADKGILDEESRAAGLSAVAQALAQVRDHEGLQRVLTAVESIGDEWSRAEALSGVAQALAQVRDLEGLQRAMVVAQGIGDDIFGGRGEALRGMAKALAQIEDHEGALALAEVISDGKWRAEALIDVAQALAQVSDREGVSSVLKRAMLTAEAISDGRWRAQALSRVAQVLTQVGHRDRALATLERALVTVEGIDDVESRADVLRGVAHILAEVACLGDNQVGSWIGNAFARARALGRDEVLIHIAACSEVLAKLGVIIATWDRMQTVEAVLYDQL